MNIVREEERGELKIKIATDIDAESPSDWGDDNLFLLGFDRRNFWVERAGYTQGLIECAVDGGKYEDGSINDEARELARDYHILPVREYVHSGVSLSLEASGQFADRWDSGGAGVLLAKKSEFKTLAQAVKAGKALIEAWNDYLSGNVYGYLVEDSDGEIIDSCYGFYGDYNAEGGALSEARRVADGYLSRKKIFRVRLVIPFDYEVEAKTKAEAAEKAHKLAKKEKEGMYPPFNFEREPLKVEQLEK